MTTPDSSLSRLQVPVGMAFLQVVLAFVEKAGAAYGLARPEALNLTLAAEEIFTYHCRVAPPRGRVNVTCKGGVYYAEVDFTFDEGALDPRAFNLTARPAPDDEASLDDIGLVIASRSVDRFHIQKDADGGLHVRLVKERVYPEGSALPVPPVRFSGDFSVSAPDPEEVKLFIALAQARYGGQVLPGAFRFPGKVVDMVASGEYRMAVARGRSGAIGGGVVWFRPSPSMVAFFGPYAIDRETPQTVAQSLLEACIGDIARSSALGMFTRVPSADLPLDQFEELGSVTLFRKGAAGDPVKERVRAFFRLMHEDPGTPVWSHAELAPFLESEYRRLVLPRDIRRTQPAGETDAPHSVLSAELDRPGRIATLRPAWWGADAEKNVRDHVRLLRSEGVENLFFEMDLGRSWEVRFTSAVLAAGFVPRLILPYGGESDLVVFQRDVP